MLKPSLWLWIMTLVRRVLASAGTMEDVSEVLV
jgi:hypothetical protein